MASFMDYYAEELRKRGVSASPSVPSRASAPKVSAYRGGPQSEPTDMFSDTSNPIGWTLDMLSRPLFGVTNLVNKTAEQGATAQAKFNEGDVGGGLAEVLGNALFAPGRVLEGIFSNDPEAKRYTGETIEHVTDTFGALDPNYEDVQDNVNPVVKGVAGFAGDVALDPLTWIPGAQIAKVANMLGQGGKAVVTGAKGALAGAKDAVRGEKATEAVVDAAKVAEDSPVEVASAVDNVFEDATESAIPMPASRTTTEAPTGFADRVMYEHTMGEGLAPETASWLHSPAAEADLSSDMVALLRDAYPAPAGSVVDEILKVSKTEQAAEKAVEAVATGKSLKQIIAESPRTGPAKNAVADLLSALKSTAATGPVAPVKLTNQGFKDFVSANMERSFPALQLPGDPVAARRTVAQLDTIARTDKGQRGKAAAAFLKSQYERQAKGDAASAVLTGSQAVQARIKKGETALRQVLGDETVDRLATLSGSEKTKSALRDHLVKLESIFGGHVDNLEAFAQERGNRNLIAAVESAYRTPFTEAKSAVKTPEQVAQVSEQIELSPVSKAFSSTLRQENLPSTPEFRAKYTDFAHGNPVAKSADKTADWWRLTNTFTQYGIYRRLQSYIEQQTRSVSGKTRDIMAGPPRAAAQRKAVEELGQEITDAMETFGTGLYIGISGDMPHLAFPEVYREVGRVMDEMHGVATTNFVLHNWGSALPMTRFLNVVAEALTNPAVTRDELAAFIRKTTKDTAGGNSTEKLPNNLLSPKGAYKGEWAGISKSKDLPEQIADAILAARPVLLEASERNAADWAARGISESRALAGAHLRKVTALTNNEARTAKLEAARLLARRETEIADEAAAIATTPEGTRGAVLSTEASAGADVIKDAEILTTQANKLTAGEDFVEAGTKAADDFALQAHKTVTTQADIDDILGQEMPNPKGTTDDVKDVIDAESVDIAALADARIQSATQGRLFERLNKAFSRNYDIDKRLRDVSLARKTWTGQIVTEGIVRPVKALTKAFQPQTLSDAMKALQQGTRLDPASEVGQAAAQMETIMSKILNVAEDGPTGNLFTESGASVDHINKILSWAFKGHGIQPQFDASAKTITELNQQWRNWNLSADAADSIVRLGQAAGVLVEQKAIVSDFVRTGLDNGFVKRVPEGGKAPEGYVRFVSSGDTQLTRLLPDDIVVEKGLAPTWARMEYLLTESRMLSGELGDLVRGTITPLTNAWKTTMTIYRPGHHIRNAIGNISLQYVARGTRDLKRSSDAAMKMLARRNNYEGMDFLNALRSLGDEALPTGGDVLVRGKFGDISNDELYEAMARHGLFPTYEASEGLMTSEVRQGSLIERITRPIEASNNPVGRVGAKVSEGLDHFGRAHHFIQILMQESRKSGGKFRGVKSKEDLFKRAAEEVRKFHPDSSMLTGFENSTMKLAIPFYSWMRGVLPGAIESALQHPGRVLTFPKASYNAAIAAGLNPDSMADPFPEDQLFPSFIREATFGPQFQVGDAYVRMNPGIAHVDLSESLGLGNENPVEGLLRGVLGMTNPLVRVPAEIASGGSWSTGARINDTSDYIDQSIPVVNYLSNLSGMSLTGSIAGLGPDPQLQVARGNKTDFDKALTGINWLTGLGFQNLSRPNYINYAEIERRNAAGEQK